MHSSAWYRLLVPAATTRSAPARGCLPATSMAGADGDLSESLGGGSGDSGSAGPPSGHGRAKKAIFSTSLTSWASTAAVTGGCRDVYALRFHVSIGALGGIQILHNIALVGMDVLIGHMQDKELMVSRCFAKERWGRRAPWILVHTPVLAVAMYSLLAPPSLDATFLVIWYFVTVLVALWSAEHLIIANQAGSAEIYPFKEERVVVESFNVLMAVIGVVLGVFLVSSPALGNECLIHDPSARTSLGVAAAVVSCASIASVWSIQDARQPSDAAQQLGFVASAKEAFEMDAFRVLCVANLLDGMANNLVYGFFIFYLTFVSELNATELASYVTLVPTLGFGCQVVCGAFWGKYFSSKDHQPSETTAYGRLADACITPWLYIMSTSLEMFIIAFTVNRILESPRSFWANAARGWIVDEDALKQAAHGKAVRREAMFASISAAAGKVSAMIVSGLIAAQALVGMDTSLVQHCGGEKVAGTNSTSAVGHSSCDSPAAKDEGLPDAVSVASGCIEGAVSVDLQPHSAILYIRFIFIVLLPLLNVAQYLCIKRFPIKGARLHALEEKQAAAYISSAGDELKVVPEGEPP